MPLQLETLIQLMEWFLGKVIPINVLCWLLLVAGSLPALLIWISITDKTGGQYLKPSLHDIGEGAGALVKYQVGTVNLALVNAVFEMKRVRYKTK